jgi:hypothetical protein
MLVHWKPLLIVLIAASCARDPLEVTCPAVRAGDLVVSEIRGRQSSTTDPYGQWIEIYNTTASPVRLAGLAVEMTTLNGSAVSRFEIHDDAAQIGAQGYFVLGRFGASTKPSYVDYAYGDVLTDDIPAGAGVDLLACATVVDHMVYRGLPTKGTWCLDGAKAPDTVTNDNESAWCADATANGTPQQRNFVCVH